MIQFCIHLFKDLKDLSPMLPTTAFRCYSNNVHSSAEIIEWYTGYFYSWLMFSFDALYSFDKVLFSFQFFLSLLMEELGLCLSKTQYYSMMEILESFEMMTRNEPFRKYKPLEKLHDAPRKWYAFYFLALLQA